MLYLECPNIEVESNITRYLHSNSLDFIVRDKIIQVNSIKEMKIANLINFINTLPTDIIKEVKIKYYELDIDLNMNYIFKRKRNRKATETPLLFSTNDKSAKKIKCNNQEVGLYNIHHYHKISNILAIIQQRVSGIPDGKLVSDKNPIAYYIDENILAECQDILITIGKFIKPANIFIVTKAVEPDKMTNYHKLFMKPTTLI